jgi:hypothetical protein
MIKNRYSAKRDKNISQFHRKFLFCFYDGVAKVFPLKQFSIHHPARLKRSLLFLASPERRR